MVLKVRGYNRHGIRSSGDPVYRIYSRRFSCGAGPVPLVLSLSWTWCRCDRHVYYRCRFDHGYGYVVMVILWTRWIYWTFRLCRPSRGSFYNRKYPKSPGHYALIPRPSIPFGLLGLGYFVGPVKAVVGADPGQ